MENIQLFVPKIRVEETLEAIRPALERGWPGMGYLTLEIEEKWKSYSGYSYAHFLNSNTSGLHLALEVLKRKNKWANDAEVITTSLTFVSTNHAILYADMIPVFADVDDSLCLSPESIKSVITPKTKALIYVGIGGNSGRYKDVLKICKENGIALILDAAHMAGTKTHEGPHIGTDADVAVYSFQAVKNLPTADSGMICFNNEEDDSHARRLSWLGINKDTYARSTEAGTYKWQYEVDELGYKYHGNSIMAAMALVGLKYLDEDNKRRREMAQLYIDGLQGVENIKIIIHSDDATSSRHLFQIRIPNRDSVMNELNNAGIYPGVHYRDNTDYSLYHFGAGKAPIAHKICDELLSLPMHLGLTDEDIFRVISTLTSAVKSCNAA
ncbi:dTDP-4-amino-4,6-dideoxygalactose transaminase [Aurantimicrobium minutum]|uniref:DegT/DnrJ/EryC1/StrS family aminotransferase n=1 Tax=Aurantimicrobium minutum TaxID=708131 RepID=UPI0024733C34|nr:DegT/DnrJ/EryC1/StrS family aminotransferase [Aurantimicrobium minutum]MDH6533356.1 dTDP-4-amino-4,6-dideoxygalactose transaminase [Aurantimicrobium minutum]